MASSTRNSVGVNLKCLGDDLGARCHRQGRLANEQGGHRCVVDARASPRARGQRQGMGDVALAVRPDQRHCDSLGAKRCVALPSGCKYLPQRLVNLRVAGCKPSAGVMQDVTRIENGMPRRIGMNDTSVRIDEIQAGFEPIERIGECPGLRNAQIEHSGNQNRAANVRSDQAHAMTRFVIDEAVALMAEDPEHDHAGCRSVEHDTDEVDKPLRPSPFPIKSGRSEFIVRHQVGSRDRLFDLCEKVSRCGWTYLSD
jgi:hypothetical protein